MYNMFNSSFKNHVKVDSPCLAQNLTLRSRGT